MNENIATGAVTISDGRGNTVTVTGVGVMVPFGWTGDGTDFCYPVVIVRPPARLSGAIHGRIHVKEWSSTWFPFDDPAINGKWTRMKPRTPAEFHQLRRILGLPPRRLILSRRGRR